MGHSIYGFNRNENHFRQLRQNVTSKDASIIEARIKKFIFTQNLSSFSKYLEACKEFDKQWILDNYKMLSQFVQKYKWNKVEKLLDKVVASWSN